MIVKPERLGFKNHIDQLVSKGNRKKKNNKDDLFQSTQLHRDGICFDSSSPGRNLFPKI